MVRVRRGTYFDEPGGSLGIVSKTGEDGMLVMQLTCAACARASSLQFYRKSTLLAATLMDSNVLADS